MENISFVNEIIDQGWPDFFVCGPNFNTNFHLRPQNLILSKFFAKQKRFWPFLVSIVRKCGQNMDYVMVFLITKRFKGRKNKLAGRSLAMPGL